MKDSMQFVLSLKSYLRLSGDNILKYLWEKDL